jgi:hypothetical protein
MASSGGAEGCAAPGRTRSNLTAFDSAPPWYERSASAIGFSAVTDAKNTDGFVVLIEPHAIVADTKAVFGRIDALEFFHVASAGLCQTLHGLLDTAGAVSIKLRQTLTSGFSPLDPFH